MNVNFSFLLLVVVALLALGQIALAVFIWFSEKEFLAELARSLGIPQKQRDSWSLWQRTFKKTQNILGQAELEGVKVVADTKYYTKQLEGVYEDQMRAVTARMEKELTAVVASGEQDFGKFLADLEKQSTAVVDSAMAAFTKRLEGRLAEVEDQLLSQTAKESAQVKKEIEEYKKTMMGTINSQMVEMVDAAVKTVVGKGLSMEAQMDLISQALEQAKKDKLIF